MTQIVLTVRFALKSNAKILAIIHIVLVVLMLTVLQSPTELFVIAHLDGQEILIMNVIIVSYFCETFAIIENC